LKAEGTVALKLAQDENRGSELELRKDKRTLKVELKEQQLAHEDVIKNMKKVYSISVAGLLTVICQSLMSRYCFLYCCR